MYDIQLFSFPVAVMLTKFTVQIFACSAFTPKKKKETIDQQLISQRDTECRRLYVQEGEEENKRNAELHTLDEEASTYVEWMKTFQHRARMATEMFQSHNKT